MIDASQKRKSNLSQNLKTISPGANEKDTGLKPSSFWESLNDDWNFFDED
jgi:hypothetical protein